jgi:glycosyltransferase involved in cell wall biosynthesis
VYPVIPASFEGNKIQDSIIGTIMNLKAGFNTDWYTKNLNLIRVPTLSEMFIPDADIIVATWWETAYFVNSYNKSKGEKYYLIQHYELWGGSKDKVDDSFKLGLKNVVHSQWLVNILTDLNAHIEAVIPHAPDLEQFYIEENKKENETIRILIPYRDIKWKGMEDGIQAFETARKKCPTIQLVMFGEKRGKDVPDYTEFHTNPSDPELRHIYNSCDIFVFPSHNEGFGIPPMEAMACGCAVATTNVGAVSEYAINGLTALISPPRQPNALADNIITLVKNKELRKNISEAGHNHILNNFSWDIATNKLEQLFYKNVVP